MFFTDYIPNDDMKYNYGYFLFFLIIINFAIGFLIPMGLILKDSCRKLYYWNEKRKILNRIKINMRKTI